MDFSGEASSDLLSVIVVSSGVRVSGAKNTEIYLSPKVSALPGGRNPAHARTSSRQYLGTLDTVVLLRIARPFHLVPPVFVHHQR